MRCSETAAGSWRGSRSRGRGALLLPFRRCRSCIIHAAFASTKLSFGRIMFERRVLSLYNQNHPYSCCYIVLTNALAFHHRWNCKATTPPDTVRSNTCPLWAWDASLTNLTWANGNTQHEWTLIDCFCLNEAPLAALLAAQAAQRTRPASLCSFDSVRCF